MSDEEKSKATKPTATPRQPRIRDYVLAILQLLLAAAKKHRKRLVIVIAVIVVLLLGLRVWSNYHKNPVLSQDELIISISKQLNISGDPNPAILTVIEKEKTNQPFLEESQDGDKVLLYYKSQKAVLYRPAEAKIIKSGSFTPPAAKIQLRQGSSVEKRLTDVEALVSKVANTKISTRDASTLNNYTQTVVVNVTGRYDNEAVAVAKALGTTLRTVPQIESIPDADILVIVGAK